jgi:DNA-binding NarL/FixJ family response regulator
MKEETNFVMSHPEPKRSIKVAIADDHALFRAGVRTALSEKTDILLIAEADNGVELLHLLKNNEPDVILLDIQMPVMDGVTALPEIRKLYPSVKIIILSMHNEHSMISKLMEIGANSYLTKNTDSDTIYEAIRTCFEQDFYFNDLTNKALLSNLRSRRNDAPPDDNLLSDKEKRTLKLLCEEKSTREIAELMGISPRTVEAIRDKLKLKTGSKTMAGLVTYAIKQGIFKPDGTDR